MKAQALGLMYCLLLLAGCAIEDNTTQKSGKTFETDIHFKDEEVPHFVVEELNSQLHITIDRKNLKSKLKNK